ncbi:MAG: hypothetical protein AB7D28_11190 [Candidatus Berkiella sp.]
MLNTDALKKLCERAKKEAQYEDIVRLDSIKKLTVQLLRQCFENNDAKSYSEVINVAIDFIKTMPSNRLDFLASLFEIKNDEIALANYALTHGGTFLIWHILQHHDLREYALLLDKDPKTIQPFLTEVMENLDIQEIDFTFSNEALIQKLKECFDSDNLYELHLYSDLFDSKIQHAYQQGDPEQVALLLKGISPLCEQALQLGKYDTLQSLFGLDTYEIIELHACYQAKAHSLINWMLVDDCHFENYAKEMTDETPDVQGFKQAVLAGMNTPKPLRNAEQLAEDYMSALQRQDENRLNMIMVEKEAILRQNFLDNNIDNYAYMLRLTLQQIKLFYQKKDYTSIAEMLDINAYDLDELLHYLQFNDDMAALYFIIENDAIDEIAFKYTCHIDAKDAERAIAFKKQLYAILHPQQEISNKALQNELISSKEQLIAMSTYSLKNIDKLTTAKADYLSFKIGQALQNAFQQNEEDKYIDLIMMSVEILNGLLSQDVGIFLQVIDLPKSQRESFLYHLHCEKLNVCAGILIENNINSHQKFLYSKNKSLKDFKTNVFKKLDLETIPEIDIDLKDEHPGNAKSASFIEYWSTKLEQMAQNFDPIATLQFKKQVDEKLKQYFKDDDLENYAEVIKLLRVFRDKCIENRNIAGATIVFQIEAEDLKPTLLLLEDGNMPYIDWLTIQQHNLRSVDYTDYKKIEGIGSFIQNVYAKLNIDLKRCFRARETIQADLTHALKEQDSDKANYYASELLDLLKQFIYAKDAMNAAKTIDTLNDMGQLALQTGQFDKLSYFFAHINVDMKLIEKCYSQQRYDLLKLCYINSFGLEETFQIIGDKETKAQLRKDIEDNIQINRQNVFSSTAHLEKLIIDALQSKNNETLKLLNLECDMMITHSFINHDPKMFNNLNKMFLSILYKAIDLKRTDLVIEYFDFDPDYIELIEMIRKSELYAQNQELIDNLWLHNIIQNNALEYLGGLYRIRDIDVQEFKLQAHHALAGTGEGTLLCPTNWINQEGHRLISQVSPDRLERLFWNAQVNAHLTFAFEQKDAKHYAEIMENMCTLLQDSFKQGSFEIMLSNIDFSFKERDALFHYLQHQNKEGILQILTEATLKQQKLQFEKKFGYRYQPDFRIDIYKHLQCPPIELIILDNQNAYPGIMHLLGDEAGLDALKWIEKRAKDIDISNPFTQDMLTLLAQNDLGNIAKYYLKATNTDNANQAANLLHALKLEHSICHRLGLTGRRKIQGIDFKVEGGLQQDMVIQLKDTIKYFYGDSEKINDLLSEIYGYKIESDEIIQNIQADLSAIKTRNNADTVQQALEQQQVVNIPVSLYLKEANGMSLHAVANSFYRNFCLLADRSRPLFEDKQGIVIGKVTKPENLKKVFNEIGASLMNSMPVDHKGYEDYVKNLIGFEEWGYIPLMAQTAGSCAWSSTAEMMHCATVFCRLHDFGLKNGLTEEKAKENAIEGSLKLNEHLIKHSVLPMVESYIKLIKNSNLDIERRTLALCFLRCQNHPVYQPIAKLVQDAKLLNPQEIDDAYDHLLNDVRKQYLLDSLAPTVTKDDELDNMARKVLDLYLHNELDAARNLYAQFIQEKIEMLAEQGNLQTASLDGKVDKAAPPMAFIFKRDRQASTAEKSQPSQSSLKIKEKKKKGGR